MDLISRVRVLGIVVAAFGLMAILAACGGPEPTQTPVPTATLPAQAPNPTATTARPVQSSTPTAVAPPAQAPETVPTPARDLAAFFQGKTISMSVGYAAGGGADTQGRLMAVHMPKYIPGNPRIVVSNRPGGGTLVNARYVAQQTGDPTVIGQISNTLITGDILGVGEEGFDWDPFIYLGMVDAAPVTSVICGRTESIADLDTFLNAGKVWKTGYISPQTSGAPLLEWMREVGMPVEIVYGYSGSNEVAAAFDRGEFDFNYFCTRAHVGDYPDWFGKDQVRPLFAFGGRENVDTHIAGPLGEGKWPWFKGVEEFINGTQDQFDALNWYLGWGGNHVWILPPDVPEDIAAAMKNAFLQAANDPAYIADMEKTRREVYPLAGDDLRGQAEGYATLSQEARDILARMHTAGRGN